MSRNEHADLTLVAAAFFQNVEYDAGCEYGSVGVDCKRPFGNSDVEGDILELIGWEPEGDDGESKRYSRKQREYAANLYCVKLASFLKAGTFTPPTGLKCPECGMRPDFDGMWHKPGCSMPLAEAPGNSDG